MTASTGRPVGEPASRDDGRTGDGRPAMGGRDAVVRVQDLRVHYQTRRSARFAAVDGVSFDITSGETLGLIGESGSGKSTVARALVRLVDSEGHIDLLGNDLARIPRRNLRPLRRKLQMVFQDPHDALDPHLSALDSIAEPLRSQGARRRESRLRAQAALERVGLGPEHGTRRPGQLSGGQNQRVNIARALVLDPEIVICDEAVSALDVSLQADILNLLVDLQRERNLAYLFISHDIAVVTSVSDRIAVMYLGQIVEIGDAAQVIARPSHPYTEALLSSRPRAVPSTQRSTARIVLEGDVPSPHAPPSGCRFRTRCRYATDRCATERPTLRRAPSGQWSACHYTGELQLVGEPTVSNGVSVT